MQNSTCDDEPRMEDASKRAALASQETLDAVAASDVTADASLKACFVAFGLSGVLALGAQTALEHSPLSQGTKTGSTFSCITF